MPFLPKKIPVRLFVFAYSERDAEVGFDLPAGWIPFAVDTRLDDRVLIWAYLEGGVFRA